MDFHSHGTEALVEDGTDRTCEKKDEDPNKLAPIPITVGVGEHGHHRRQPKNAQQGDDDDHDHPSRSHNRPPRP